MSEKSSSIMGYDRSIFPERVYFAARFLVCSGQRGVREYFSAESVRALYNVFPFAYGQSSFLVYEISDDLILGENRSSYVNA